MCTEIGVYSCTLHVNFFLNFVFKRVSINVLFSDCDKNEEVIFKQEKPIRILVEASMSLCRVTDLSLCEAAEITATHIYYYHQHALEKFKASVIFYLFFSIL